MWSGCKSNPFWIYLIVFIKQEYYPRFNPVIQVISKLGGANFLKIELVSELVVFFDTVFDEDRMSGDQSADDSLYPIAVLIDELRNEDVQVSPSP